MPAASLYLQDLILNWHRGTGMPAPPTTLYLGLDTTTDSATGGTEVAGSGYARQAVTLAAPSGSPVRASANTNTISFGPAGVFWGTIRAARFWDSVSGGNWLDFANISVGQVVNIGATVDFAPGDVTLQHK